MQLKKQKPMPRGAGVLLPVSSLPSPYGIGTFGRAAYDFVDFLSAAGQSYWQVLPLGPTSYGDSPYQSFSAFAGNPYFIDLDLLAEQGLLTREEVRAHDWGDGLPAPGSPSKVDYDKLAASRFEVLRQAYARSRRDAPDYPAFCEENAGWLCTYAEYMALKTAFGSRPWAEWPQGLRLRRPEALKAYRAKLAEEIGFWLFCQYQFYTQWRALKAYANAKGVQIIGDIPIYVALDSADVWANGELFQLDAARRPTAVAGVPPDMFSATGQLWGNPLYDWEAMERDGFSWWKDRMRASARLYDVIRIDHFIGIVRYYAIPAQEETALRGTWKAGPGKKLAEAFCEVLGGAKIIAEDLGAVTPAVRRLRKQAGYPGMKLMEFGFDTGPENENLPIHFEPNCVAYGGTHDNETLTGFFTSKKAKELAFAKRYLQVRRRREIPNAIIRAAYASVADTVIFQIQDLLGLDNSARINRPSTIGGNWEWRLLQGQIPDGLAPRLSALARTYGRVRPAERETKTEALPKDKQSAAAARTKTQTGKGA